MVILRKENEMKKNIVIFGCDNTGKTNLSRVLKDEFAAEGVEANIVTSIGKASKEEQVKFINDKLNSVGIKIFDRFSPIEEFVCGYVLRGKSNFTLSELNSFIDRVDLFIFCYPGLFSVLNWGEREQMEGVKQNVLRLINRYNDVAMYLKDEKKYIVEYNYNSIESVNDVVKKALYVGGR